MERSTSQHQNSQRFPRPSPLPLGSGGTLGHKNQDNFDDSLAELELDISVAKTLNIDQIDTGIANSIIGLCLWSGW